MKTFLKTISLSLIAIVMLVSCSKDDNNTTPNNEPEAEYTVIFYGCGGGSLDVCIELNFNEIEAMGYQEDVQFTAMFKYSTSWQEMDKAYEGTRLLTMEPSGEMSNTRVGDADLRLDDPQNLADFIIDAKRRLPAKKYILVMSNHGSGFDIRDQLVETSYTTKAICADDNTDDSSVSIFEFEAALELVGEKIDMLYWDACLMNTIENNYQIHEYFDYIIGSNHVAYISNYSILINGLMKYDDIVEAGQYYTKKIIDTWINYEIPDSCDLSLIECDKMERVVELIAEACDILCDYRDNLVEGSVEDYYYKYLNGDSSDSARVYYFSDEYNEEDPLFFYTEGGIHYLYEEGFDMIDLSRSFRFLGTETLNGELSAVTTLLNDAIDEMYLSREYLNLSEQLSDISVSVSWVSDVAYNYNYNSDDFSIQTLAELYPHLDFDKATGWGSRYLAGNVVQAVGYDSTRGTFYYIER